MKSTILSLLIFVAQAFPATAEEVETSITMSATVSWDSSADKTYQVQWSSNMETWVNTGPITQGTGEIITRHFAITPEKKFFRVQTLEQAPWFAGSWTGRLFQTNDFNQTIEVDLDPATGTYTLSATPTSGPCSGPLALLEITDTEIKLREIATGDPGDCSWDGTVIIRNFDENRLVLLWTDPAIPGASVAILDKAE